MRPGDWNLSTFSIIPILVGATPSNSLLVTIVLSKLATFLCPLRRSASLVSNSGPLENSFKRCRTSNRHFCKAQQFIVSVKQKIQKVVISSKKAQRNLQEQTVLQMISEVVGSCMTLGSNPEGNHYFNYYNFLFQIGFNAKDLFSNTLCCKVNISLITEFNIIPRFFKTFDPLKIIFLLKELFF